MFLRSLSKAFLRRSISFLNKIGVPQGEDFFLTATNAGCYSDPPVHVTRPRCITFLFRCSSSLKKSTLKWEYSDLVLMQLEFSLSVDPVLCLEGILIQQKYIHLCNTEHDTQQICNLALPKFGVIYGEINLKFNQLFRYLLASLFLFWAHG